MDKTTLFFIGLILIAFVFHKIDMYIFNKERKTDLEILKILERRSRDKK